MFSSQTMHLNQRCFLNTTSRPLGCQGKEDSMHKLATLLVAGALGLGFGGRTSADENESGHEHQTVTMAEVPAPVRATLEREAKGGKIEELRTETSKDGSFVYEAEIVKKGKATEIEVNAD